MNVRLYRPGIDILLDQDNRFGAKEGCYVYVICPAFKNVFMYTFFSVKVET
jgi:hypothetical protein